MLREADGVAEIVGKGFEPSRSHNKGGVGKRG